MLAALLVAIALAVVAWFAAGARRGLRPLAALDGAQARRRYRRTVVRSWIAFGVLPAVGLLLIGRVDAIGRFPQELATLRLPLLTMSNPASFVRGAAIGLTAGEVLLITTLLVKRRRGMAAKVPIGGAGLMPRNRGELAWAGLLAVSAGIVEELFFRLFLPLVVVLATGSAVAGLFVGAAAFGAVHRYQGWLGMLATFAIGLVLSGFYFGSGSLWLAMAVHAAINLNALVVRPLAGGVLSGPTHASCSRRVVDSD
jgi:membrane protease YdiL (CAAX protease family)